MTDRERIEKTYAKIKEKYPEMTSKEEIDALAIKLDKQNTLFIALAYLVGGIASAVAWWFMITYDVLEGASYLFLIMGGSGVFEFFRTLGKLSKIEQRYKPVIKVTQEGCLTKEILLRDGGRKLKKADYKYKLVKTPLFDKEDETDVGIDNETLHKYYFWFTVDERSIIYKVNRKAYMDAVIGTEYYLVVTEENEIAAIYQASNWTLAGDLVLDEECVIPENVEIEEQAYKPHITTEIVEPVKTKKLMPILALVLMVVAYLMPIIIGVPLGIAGLVLAIVGIAQQRSKLSITSLVVNVLLFVLLIISVVVTFMGLV